MMRGGMGVVVSDVATVGDVAGFLRGMGEGGLADRLDYLASDADLDVGEFPAADESARGFWALFCRVESDSGLAWVVRRRDGLLGSGGGLLMNGASAFGFWMLTG